MTASRSLPERELRDRAVIVTGAGAGIGLAVCRAFVEAGARVALNDIDAGRAEAAARQLNAAAGGERVRPYVADVADAAEVARMVDDFAARCGRLDVAVANAGITNYGPFLDYAVEAFDRLTAVNLRGTYFTAQAAARRMVRLASGEGRILLVSSVTGVQAFPSLSAYGATKAAIEHLAKGLALELAPHGITVNAICPGAILTERTLADDPGYETNWGGVTPTGRVGRVEDVAAAILFLASPAARHITGQSLRVDGGWSHRSPIPEEHPELPGR